MGVSPVSNLYLRLSETKYNYKSDNEKFELSQRVWTFIFSKQISVIYICIRQVATLSIDDTGYINRQMAIIASIDDTGSIIYLFVLIFLSQKTYNF